MKKALFAIIAFFVLAAWTTNNQKNDGGRSFTVTLTGEEEVPVIGDLDATGTAVITLNQGQGTLTYKITTSGIDGTITAAHIHEAPAGSAGGVVIPLPIGRPVNGSFSGVVSVSKELIKEIRQSPEDYYVNVHSTAFPGGAVRGQLSK